MCQFMDLVYVIYLHDALSALWVCVRIIHDCLRTTIDSSKHDQTNGLNDQNQTESFKQIPIGQTQSDKTFVVEDLVNSQNLAE